MVSFYPNDLNQARQLKRHHKQTIESFRCEGAESPLPSFSSPFVERIRDNFPLNSSNEVTTSASSPSVSYTSTSEERPRRSTRGHHQPQRFQYYGFGQPAYLRPVFSNFVPVMDNNESFRIPLHYPLVMEFEGLNSLFW